MKRESERIDDSQFESSLQWGWTCILVLWGALIIYMALLPSEMTPPLTTMTGLPFSDKLVHFGLYCMGGILVAGRFGNRFSYHWLWLSVLVFGLIDEGLQALARPAELEDIVDWIMDLLGSGTGILVWLWVKNRLGESSFRYSQVSVLMVSIIALGVGMVFGHSLHWGTLYQTAVEMGLE